MFPLLQAVENDNSSTNALPTEEAKNGVREGNHKTILYASMLGEPFMQVDKTSGKEFVWPPSLVQMAVVISPVL